MSFVLPISGVTVQFRRLDGHDELLLAEGAAHLLVVRVEAVRRLVPPADGALHWNSLPYADVDAALLAFRRRVIGDRLVAEVRCGGCGAWCDTELSISQYLSARRPRRVAGVRRDCDGWYSSQELRFRVLTVADVLEAVSSPAVGMEVLHGLAGSCIAGDSPEQVARATSLLERIAPCLPGPVRGTCPHCTRGIRGWFDPGSFVLAELRARAAVLFDHIHLLARAYGWSEERILQLPAQRRARYAARIEEEQTA